MWRTHVKLRFWSIIFFIASIIYFPFVLAFNNKTAEPVSNIMVILLWILVSIAYGLGRVAALEKCNEEGIMPVNLSIFG